MSPGDSTVLFRAPSEICKLNPADRRAIKEFAARLTEQVAAGRPFTCLLTTDEALRDLNRDFLQHDYATDVLSFPALAPARELGELAISIERADAQAAEFGHSRLDEIRILMLHGVLHLLGFDHERDSGEMAGAEAQWRQRLALPLTLIARVEVAR